jgi:hypothetical protein
MDGGQWRPADRFVRLGHRNCFCCKSAKSRVEAVKAGNPGNPEAVGARIRELRNEGGWTQDGFGDLPGLDRA